MLEAAKARGDARRIVGDGTLDDRQRKQSLAALAEGLLDYVPLGAEASELLARGVICDLREGPAPYRPRYVLPDYALALKQGSKTLELDPPEDLDDALNFLLILYGHVPSITGYPVFLGDLDTLLEPFASNVDDAALARKIKLFLRAVDRLLPDAFVHATLGPDDSRVARAVLRAERELAQVVPNLSLRVDPERTPDDLLLDGVRTVLRVGKPHFVNHPLMVRDLGERYGVASCYNSLPIGGGSHTLVRLNLHATVERFDGSVEAYLEGEIPRVVAAATEVIAARVRHVVEEARFFEHHFLAREGLVSLERFSAMFGLFALAEAVNTLRARAGSSGRYGRDSSANELARRIVARVAECVREHPIPYCEGNGGRAFLHAQSGIDGDVGLTPGVRVPFDDEPELLEHILTVAPLHGYFQAGVSDVFHFDETLGKNPQAAIDVMRGAFRQGMRDFTFDIANSEFVRVTGYLVRRSDLASFERGGSRYDSTVLAARTVEQRGLFGRRPRHAP